MTHFRRDRKFQVKFEYRGHIGRSLHGRLTCCETGRRHGCNVNQCNDRFVKGGTNNKHKNTDEM